jgi:uncharacterized protein (DUF433 family)
MSERIPDQPVAPHIVLRTSVTGTQPVLDRIGIKVKLIAQWYLAGKPVREFVDELELTPAEVHAAMAYYYDHKSEIDARIRDDKRVVEEVRAANPSRIPRPASA